MFQRQFRTLFKSHSLLRLYPQLEMDAIRAHRLPLTSRMYSSGFKNEDRVDKHIFSPYLLLVAVFGTAVFVKVSHSIKQNQLDNKRPKDSYTEEEWQQHLAETKRQRFAFTSGEEFYLFPFAANSSKQVKQLVKKLGGDETVATVDLNDVVKAQLDDPSSNFGVLLRQTLEKEDPKSDTCSYIFKYTLSPGVFTHLVQEKALRLRKENPKVSRFVVLNYPNTIEEAVKFEQKVSVVSKVVTGGREPNDNRIIDYFGTVDKVVSVDKLPKMEPKVLSQKPIVTKVQSRTEDAGVEPAADAPAIKKAQYKLRSMGEPIRRYGETDQNVIDRLSKILKG